MKIKVFLSILFGFLLVIAINGVGNAVGDMLHKKAAGTVFLQTFGDESEAIDSKSELAGFLSTPEYYGKFKVASQEVSETFKWYFVSSFAVQTLLILLVAWVCSSLVIGIVRRRLEPQESGRLEKGDSSV